jgi:hypothetical protein
VGGQDGEGGADEGLGASIPDVCREDAHCVVIEAAEAGSRRSGC